MPDSKERGLKIVVSDFVENLPNTLTGARISIINLPRTKDVGDFLDAEIKSKSFFIKADSSREFTEKLKEGLKTNDIIFVEFGDKFPTEIINHLKSISSRNLFEYYDPVSNQNAVEVLKDETKVILVAERKFIETQFGNLNNLTTQILDLEEFI